MIYYAKTNPVETIKEHTDNVIEEYENLKKNYKSEIDEILKDVIDPEYFWYLLKLCCKYHDYGKSNLQFQNKLREKLGEKTISCEEHEEIIHNYLSPAFLPTKELKQIPEDLKRIIFQAIAYHHERDIIIDKEKITEIKEYVQKELNKQLVTLNEHMGDSIEKTFSRYTDSIRFKYRVKEKEPKYKVYVMLKGLIHRLDHSASAHVLVEEEEKNGVGNCTKKFFKAKGWEFRSPQTFSIENKESNTVIIASTGIGKTESALLWIDDKKGFFTLPLRVSLNALYSRVKSDIGYDSVGLLHSSALEYMEDHGYEDAYKSYEETALLSKKLSFSTIDQIFKYPFKYKGYEKVLATLAYSKVVIDEIQAYSPEIVAVILYAIKQLTDLGGKFMIMTATLPRIYKEKLEEFNIKFKEEKFILDKDRHRIKIEDKEIIDSIDKVIEIGKTKKVLVIVNTVDKAIEYYKRVEKEETEININLLHSLFNNKDRSIKEEQIKDFTNEENKESGIWITTQIVEASLDVDFDYLFTEMSTLDSQFQRFGRCFRKRVFTEKYPNILIHTKNVSGFGSIYDEEIFNKSIELLLPYDEQILKENVKVELVDKLYSKELLRGSKFYEKFIEACDILENIVSYEIKSSEAQKMLRDIDTIRVIPEELYNENIDLFETIESCNFEERAKLFKKINKLTISVPKKKLDKNKKINENIKAWPIEKVNGIFLINAKYTTDEGLCLGELSENIF
ncbi:CRISPR-associated helicase Cas3' [Clostridium cibarium]|uniref:CRISPR-associated helicase Cas3 n=1 Tax=Clostridium cibarium TaxID=2762247 RepID=A0ABR8PVA3_9CLOT|nr:CRISPR-associated helicase Cas3' [Clostridium cibarium]MBD7912067.1 CRISPR-associated helicase Cas3' [Clostridium cibarium]